MPLEDASCALKNIPAAVRMTARDFRENSGAHKECGEPLIHNVVMYNLLIHNLLAHNLLIHNF